MDFHPHGSWDGMEQGGAPRMEGSMRCNRNEYAGCFFCHSLFVFLPRTVGRANDPDKA